ncbi:MAG: pyruvate dehydrogenase (acetyl-transferring), homodimeric type [Enterovibrio sp.]
MKSAPQGTDLKTLQDIDPSETKEWLEAFESVLAEQGAERAHYLLQQVLEKAERAGISLFGKAFDNTAVSDYLNTIIKNDQVAYPGELSIEKQISSIIRWNAVMMILRAAKKDLELGGHIASYQSASAIYETCFHHIFRAANEKDGGDFVYFQGHCAPGIYARAFVEGRLTEQQLDNFRQEVAGKGLSSYPHPKLMPEFWQFPTVSMGLGPISAIYQARFLKYLQGRGLKETGAQRVYAFLGDGEMDEPESRGAISFAAREKLDNLCFVINCNLQRLDGPVFGNGKIVQELEGLFRGAGWNVIKVLWSSAWDELFAKDSSGKLVQLLNETLDGDFQTFKTKDGAYVREHFFGKYPETAQLVADLSDEQLLGLDYGGHDPQKLYAAFAKAKQVSGKPTLILAKTVKGHGLGAAGESRNIAHQVKKLSLEQVTYLRDRLNLKHLVSDEKVAELPYLQLQAGSAEYNYLHEKRQALQGFLPARRTHSSLQLTVPTLDDFAPLLEAQSREISTTMAFVRVFNHLLKSKLAKHLVPIIGDEARTFGMEGLFRQIGIYSPYGQNYKPEDHSQLAFYKESTSGQVLQEGINELGAMGSWLAAGISYSCNDLPMIPFYIFYSMFGFQRVGDMAWLAADNQARGFLLGATSGRTTLNGEGLQHEDGHSHVLASTIPNCIAYDPAYAYEVAVIVQQGLQRMYGENPENVFYYITLLNENYAHPAIPEGVQEGITRGIYKLETVAGDTRVQLLGSGSILNEVRKAARILSEQYGVGADVYSVTSYNELARDGQACAREDLLSPHSAPHRPYIASVLNERPAIAASDYVKNHAEQVRAFVPAVSYKVLGTDGFGRSDSRANLRHHFEVDAAFIVVTALSALAERGECDKETVAKALAHFAIDPQKINPLHA